MFVMLAVIYLIIFNTYCLAQIVDKLWQNAPYPQIGLPDVPMTYYLQRIPLPLPSTAIHPNTFISVCFYFQSILYL